MAHSPSFFPSSQRPLTVSQYVLTGREVGAGVQRARTVARNAATSVTDNGPVPAGTTEPGGNTAQRPRRRRRAKRTKCKDNTVDSGLVAALSVAAAAWQCAVDAARGGLVSAQAAAQVALAASLAAVSLANPSNQIELEREATTWNASTPSPRSSTETESAEDEGLLTVHLYSNTQPECEVSSTTSGAPAPSPSTAPESAEAGVPDVRLTEDAV